MDDLEDALSVREASFMNVVRYHRLMYAVHRWMEPTLAELEEAVVIVCERLSW